MYEVFEKLLKEHGITIYRFCKEAQISESTIYTWKKKGSTISGETAKKIADYFGVTMDYLMTGEERPENRLPEGAIPLDPSTLVQIPVIGSIICGEPMFEESNIEEYEYVPREWITNGYTFFFLRAKGDSMINAGIDAGDLLLIRAQSDVDSGDIAVININGDEETLKRVIKKERTVVLQPENPAYETKIFAGRELNDIHIQGRLMRVIKKF